MRLKKRTLIPTFAAASALAFSTPYLPVATAEEGSKMSDHFEAVSGHLELGGEVFLYVDVDGDVSKIAGMLDDLLKFVDKASGGDMPPELAALDVGDLADQLGLSGIAALGASSMQKGETFRNTYYLHVPDGREGLLKVFGGEAAPFAVQKLAPAGSDLVMEQDINIAALYDLALDMAKEIGGPRAKVEFQREMSEQIPGTPLSMDGILSSLDTKVILIGDLDASTSLKLPEEVPFKVPGVNLLIALDNVGDIFSKLTMTIPAEHKARMMVETDDYQQLTIPVPPEVAGIMQPVIRHDKKSGRVMAATSAEYLDKCLSGATTVWEDEDFKTAMAGLPEEGNAMSYVSSFFIKEYIRIYGSAMDLASKEGGMPLGMSEMLIGLVTELGMDPDHPQGVVTTNLPQGILSVGNSPGSAKQGVVAMAAAGVGFMAGMMMPYMAMAESRAYERAYEAELRMEEKIRELERHEERARDGELDPAAPAPAYRER